MNNHQNLAESIGVNKALELAGRYYGLEAHQCRKLAGEVDQNFLIYDSDHRYVLKISRQNAQSGDIEFQTAILRHLHEKRLNLELPVVLPTKHNDSYATTDDHRLVRLHGWVNGVMLADVNPILEGLLFNWGQSVGLLSQALEDFDHPRAHRFYKWNPSEALYSRKFREYIDNEKQSLADYFWDLFEKTAFPVLTDLRKSVNYNDAHIHNLLCVGPAPYEKVTGVIDFGDALYCETINELAIACAYAGMQQVSPLEAMAKVVEGYHSVFSVTEPELEVLFSLIAARLTISTASAAYNRHLEPENKYLTVSEEPAWTVLEKLRSIPPALAHYTFRRACGFEPCPQRERFDQWIGRQTVFHSVVNLDKQSVVEVDLSVSSPELGNHDNYASRQKLQKRILQILEEKEAKIGWGGYAEVRPFYTTDAYQLTGNDGAVWRTVHLGMDIWTDAMTPVYAPFDGTVYSAQNNEGERNYGPTIIIEHVFGDLTFYTLFGHLSLDSLTDNMNPGMPISVGQRIGEIGPAPENGNWPPHLHFQILLDTLDFKGDFPGVAFPKEKEIWCSICPDPTRFIGMQGGQSDPITPEVMIGKRSEILGKKSQYFIHTTDSYRARSHAILI